MLSDMEVAPTLPVVDIERARKFYEKKLGLKVSLAGERDVFFECGKGTTLYIYTPTPTEQGDTVVAGFIVDDIEAEMQSLRKKGINFEDYDLPDIKTVNGIATRAGGDRSAWFRDSEGNILALHQMGS